MVYIQHAKTGHICGHSWKEDLGKPTEETDDATTRGATERLPPCLPRTTTSGEINDEKPAIKFDDLRL